MPISGPPKSKKAPKQPPAPPSPEEPDLSYPMVSDLSPEEVDALLAEGYVDYGDGELIPPLDDNPFVGGGRGMTPGMEPGAPLNAGLGAANPGASAAGGPATPQSGIRSDIFRTLYRTGKRGGNPLLMDMGRPPLQARGLPEPPPLPGMEPEEEPFLLQAPSAPTPSYSQPPSPRGPGPNAPIRRFPRASSLMSGAGRNQQPRRGRGY